MGVIDNKVSVFEFVRAVAPRDLSLKIQRSMVREVLKRVWLLKPWLLSTLSQMDARGMQKVSVQQFYQALTKMNQLLLDRGRQPLTDAQIGSICEIACGGTREVEYQKFLRGLHIRDVEVTPRSL